MWLDIVILFPLIMISFNKLVNQGKWVFFSISLACAVYINFYLSFSLAIFFIIFFALTIFKDVDKDKRSIISLKFLLSDLIAVLISAPFWLTSLLQIMQSGRGESDTLAKGFFFANWTDKVAILSATPLFITLFILAFLFRSMRRNTNYKMIIILLISAFV